MRDYKAIQIQRNVLGKVRGETQMGVTEESGGIREQHQTLDYQIAVSNNKMEVRRDGDNLGTKPDMPQEAV